MGIRLGLVGLGAFGSEFAKLFKAHPLVDRIALCDREPDRIKKFSEDSFMQDKLNSRDCYESLGDICRADLDAIVIITQPWLHAPQCIQVLESGKHVYSAVPVIWLPDGQEILDWCSRLKDTVARTGKHYMLGETTCYRSATMFCRRMAAEGRFGDYVYAEGEYAHDLDADYCSLREVNAARTTGTIGSQYDAFITPYRKRGIKDSPMFYPTHSVSGPLSVMKTRAKKVTAIGYRNQNNDAYFNDSAFSNVTAFFTMANGATLRISEYREIGCHAMDRHKEETFRIFGTRGSFARNIWEDNHRTVAGTACPMERQQFTDAELRDPLPSEVATAFKQAMQPSARPEDAYIPEGHGGSHPYLVHEFCSAVAANRTPAIDIREAAAYMAMGVAAHESALRDGESTNVVNFD